jgi:hypothetical protein
MKHRKTELITVTMLVIIAVLTRLIPHPPNFTPILAIALFSGHSLSKSNKPLAYAIPLAIIFISDLVIGFHSTIAYVYTSILAITFLGQRANIFKSVKNIGISSVFASSMFFIITNTAIWLHSDMYTKSLTGLLSCYSMAIPFFHNTLLSTICYVLAFKIIYEMKTVKDLQNRVVAVAKYKK